MAENSKIEWTDHTFNPWEGCQKVGPGCDHCYAEARNARFGGGTAVNWGPGAPRRRTSEYNWKKPIHWNANHESFFAKYGRRQRVFCASLADVFDNEVDPAWRADLFRLIHETPNLDWLLLTKRIGNARSMIQDALNQGHLRTSGSTPWPWPQVLIGATIVNQEEADRDIPKLLAVPAARRFLSMEPLLGDVNIKQWLQVCCGLPNEGHPGDYWTPPDPPQCCGGFEPGGIHQVIVGGESGAGARPMHPNWVRSLRDQCEAAGVPFLLKQWGEWLPGHQYTPELQMIDGNFSQSRYQCADLIEYPDGTSTWQIGFRHSSETGEHALYRVGKKAAGRLLDDVEHNGFPEDITK